MIHADAWLAEAMNMIEGVGRNLNCTELGVTKTRSMIHDPWENIF